MTIKWFRVSLSLLGEVAWWDLKFRDPWVYPLKSVLWSNSVTQWQKSHTCVQSSCCFLKEVFVTCVSLLKGKEENYSGGIALRKLVCINARKHGTGIRQLPYVQGYFEAFGDRTDVCRHDERHKGSSCDSGTVQVWHEINSVSQGWAIGSPPAVCFLVHHSATSILKSLALPEQGEKTQPILFQGWLSDFRSLWGDA